MAKNYLGNIMGPCGPAGEAGPAGYTPKKFVDYFTEEDIKYLEAYYAPATESTDYPGCYYRTVDGLQEWINAPMLPDVEYLTTERWAGKPVYIKYISTFGGLPDTAEKKIPLDVDAGATVISLGGYAKLGNAYRELASVGEVYVDEGWNLCIKTNWDASTYAANVVLKYIKA